MNPVLEKWLLFLPVVYASLWKVLCAEEVQPQLDLNCFVSLPANVESKTARDILKLCGHDKSFRWVVQGEDVLLQTTNIPISENRLQLKSLLDQISQKTGIPYVIQDGAVWFGTERKQITIKDATIPKILSLLGTNFQTTIIARNITPVGHFSLEGWYNLYEAIKALSRETGMKVVIANGAVVLVGKELDQSETTVAPPK
jgi:hypothetical protein